MGLCKTSNFFEIVYMFLQQLYIDPLHIMRLSRQSGGQNKRNFLFWELRSILM